MLSSFVLFTLSGKTRRFGRVMRLVLDPHWGWFMSRRLPWVHRSSGTSVADLKESIALASAAGRLWMQPDDLGVYPLVNVYITMENHHF